MCEKNLEQRGIRMEQYKVILVDDEAEVIDIMEAKIRWSELGFEVVGSAKNGVKALELVEKLQPDRYQNALYGWAGTVKETESGLSEYLYYPLYRL